MVAFNRITGAAAAPTNPTTPEAPTPDEATQEMLRRADDLAKHFATINHIEPLDLCEFCRMLLGLPTPGLIVLVLKRVRWLSSLAALILDERGIAHPNKPR